MLISPDLLSATISPAVQPPPTAEPDISPATQVPTIENWGNALSDDARDALYAGARDMEEAGASEEQVREFVENQLESQGASVPEGAPKTGRLIDVFG